MKTLLIYTTAVTLLLLSSAPRVAAQESEEKSRSEAAGEKKSSEKDEAATYQILLDKAGFSPGSIDGKWGDDSGRTRLALKAFQQEAGLEATGKASDETSQALEERAGGGELFTEYQITEADAKGPFAPELKPGDWKQMAEMDRLSYRSLEEKLGERFHSDPDYLKQLNPGKKLAAGETIKVPAVKPLEIPASDDAPKPKSEGGEQASELVISGSEKTLRVIGDGGKLLFFAPITPGSEALPLPSGEEEVTAFDVNPKYYFDPEKIPSADLKEKKTIPPGPNGPVGVLWIDLSKDGYGIHGTPEPEKIGYTTSHGCVRLTNWDIIKVAGYVNKGTKVRFVDSGASSGEGSSKSANE
jgi:lipoprotein-anchoring transpeptidase ErfK/SrfK